MQEEVVVEQRRDPSRTEHRSFGPLKPIRNNRPKIRRNAPCPCGSGKKWKHCHLPEQQ